MQQESSIAPQSGEKAYHFDATLTPHRSLSPQGFLILMSAVGAISFSAGLAFFLAGAWPVVGFLGLDVALIYIAFRINYRQGRLREELQLTDHCLFVRRTLPNGKTEEFEFQPHWIQVLIDLPLRHDSQLTLRSHGRSVTVGAFLTPKERLEVAGALKKALRGLRAGEPSGLV